MAALPKPNISLHSLGLPHACILCPSLFVPCCSVKEEVLLLADPTSKESYNMPKTRDFGINFHSKQEREVNP
jgi:hypothetical protein